ncbi:hypothetical protein [Croceibacterium aestuarii]|uniref:hypothetical protein n=1 Tax=Croceibacterium aestuarii TaxID=3064139 RepID=UPI00272EB5B4|nr:hypothetical protein [Croceibacterium sp. D39]
MHKFIFAGVAALAVAAMPAMAQDADAAVTLTTEQQATFDTWPPDRQTVYLAWDPIYQDYFWTLTPDQQKNYFLLTPQQKAQIAAMTPAQRTEAWTSIAQQVGAAGKAKVTANTAAAANAQAAPPPSATAVVTDNDPATPPVVAHNDPGNLTAPPASVLNKTYPVCSRKVHDSCQNPGEGGAPGHSRALSYWPGKPASQLDDNENDNGG